MAKPLLATYLSPGRFQYFYAHPFGAKLIKYYCSKTYKLLALRSHIPKKCWTMHTKSWTQFAWHALIHQIQQDFINMQLGLWPAAKCSRIEQNETKTELNKTEVNVDMRVNPYTPFYSLSLTAPILPCEMQIRVFFFVNACQYLGKQINEFWSEKKKTFAKTTQETLCKCSS